MRRRGRPSGSRDRLGAAVCVDRRVRKPTAWRPLAADFGRRLSQLLDERDVAASELAAALGKSAQTVFSWTRGDRLPSIMTMAQVALALRCSIVDLMPESAHHMPQPARRSA